MKKKIKRKEFYKNVTFKDKDSKKYLRDPIYHFAMQSKNIFTKFENFTNFVSHATYERHRATGKVFSVSYPVTISGTSISNIQIEDAKGDIFNISLATPNKVIYYEKHEYYTDCFIATCCPDKDENMFERKRIHYHTQPF